MYLRRTSVTTMRLTIVLASIVFLLGLGVASFAQALSLSGSLYRIGSNGNEPIVDAKAYLRQSSGKEIGPALTDSYGRYAFYDVGADNYHMAIYVQNVLKWEGNVTVPGSVPPIVLRQP